MTEPPSGRADTLAGRLARLGVTDAQRAGAALMGVGWWSLDLLDEVGAAADPGQVVRTALDLQAADPQRMGAVAADARAWRRFAQTTGVSLALAEHLVRHPEHLEILFEDSPPPGAQALRAQIVDAASGMGAGAADALRVAYRAAVLRIAIADVVHGAPFELTALRLSELADAVLSGALAAAHEQLPDSAPQARLAIIGMGKCGGRELNYISDVDVIFVAEPAEGVEESEALRTATTLASTVMRLCSQPTAEGSIWEVDANLRPEGRAGALVRTLRSHVGYYERWAKTWEFQALLKARAVAGDEELGAAYIDAVLPFVWSAANRSGFVTETQQMRQRVERNVPAKDADRQLKLGRGGLRDVEFSVQLLQLVHGRSDVMLRSPTTLTALESLATWGYVGREDASGLAGAYRFLRTLEHRIQMHRMVRSHVVPREDEDLRRLGRSMGFMADPGKELVEAWQRRAHEVRRIHEKLFYRPLLDAVARLDSGQARLTPAGGPRAPRRPGLPGPGRRAEPHRGAHLRGEPAGGDPAHAAAGDARMVRRRAGPGCRPARLPAGQRGPRWDALVPAAAARRVGLRRADGPGAGQQPVRLRAAAAGPRRRGPARRCRRAAPPAVRSAHGGVPGHRRAVRRCRRGGGRRARPAPARAVPDRGHRHPRAADRRRRRQRPDRCRRRHDLRGPAGGDRRAGAGPRVGAADPDAGHRDGPLRRR